MEPARDPWRSAGTQAAGTSAEDAARAVGWVFNNELDQPLDEFVDSGSIEVQTYGTTFGLLPEDGTRLTLVEVGSGIGRMTAGFTRHFGRVIACDVDAAFLERCRETVAQRGGPGSLETAHVADGAHLPLPAGVADVVFSYITLQHCSKAAALSLAAEAARTCRPGGRIALNFRSAVFADVVMVPAGALVRLGWRLFPGWQALRSRAITRLGWQANRLGPRPVLRHLERSGHQLGGLRLVEHADRPRWRRWLPSWRDTGPWERLDWINRSHWWLVADIG
jgi:SAM-dependent methyltransferase